MRVVPVPCLRDNYAYIVACDGAREAVVVDPSEAEPVLAALIREGLELLAILNTHHHPDHVGGNEALCERFGALPVFGHETDLAKGRIPAQTVGVREDEPFEVAGLAFQPLHVPGHTLGAVAYVVEDAVFTGDTMFVAGCGRLFEGTPAMMYESLCQKLARLPPGTRVYCGHEYTVSNLRFAEAAEPDNEDVRRKLAEAQARRARGEPTVPSTVAEELHINPFLRVDEPSLRARYGGAGGAETLSRVRAAKDVFR